MDLCKSESQENELLDQGNFLPKNIMCGHRRVWQDFRNLTFNMGKLCLSQKPIFWLYLTAVVSY